MLLREAWERTVEERLFKGAILRFSNSVQTQRLKTVRITDEMIKTISDGMTDSSSLVHDLSSVSNPAPPTYSKLEADLQSLDDFIQTCKPG